MPKPANPVRSSAALKASAEAQPKDRSKGRSKGSKAPMAPVDDRLGVLKPVTAKSRGVRVLAWRDTDRDSKDSRGQLRPSRTKTYFLDIRMTGWPAHELLGVSADRILALSEALREIHDQIASESPQAKKGGAL